tara:strand:+ start:4161 stop:5816 length:1656 start_codon:yes stop_codon:yes gene_type:complete
MEIEEMKDRLPMPQLMDRLGIGEEFQRRSCRSPFREERKPSFGIFEHDGRWFWKDHGVNKSGDEISLIMEAKGFDKRQAIEFYRELVGAREATKSITVKKLDQSKIDEISLWRGYKPLTVELLSDRGLLVNIDGQVAIPVKAGREMMGYHKRFSDGRWMYSPKGTPALPLIIEPVRDAASTIVFESQWDAFAYIDLAGWPEHQRIVVTRGAANAAKLQGKTVGPVILFLQNDEAGEKWAHQCCDYIDDVRVCTARPPAPHNDLNDWLKDGATMEDLLRCIGSASVIKAGPEKDIMSWDDLDESTPDPDTLIGDRWMCKAGSCLWVGPSGVGKSSLTLQAALTWAAGFDLFGMTPVRPLRSLIIQAENDAGDVREAVQGVRRGLPHLSAQWPDLKQRVSIVSKADCTGTKFLAYAESMVKAVQPDLLWIDNVQAYLDGDVCSQQQVMAFLNPLRALALETGVAVQLIHHTGKSITGNRTALDWSYIGNGSSQLTNWARAVMVLMPDDEENYGVFNLRAAKRGTRAKLCASGGFPSDMVKVRHGSTGICWAEA